MYCAEEDRHRCIVRYNDFKNLVLPGQWYCNWKILFPRYIYKKVFSFFWAVSSDFHFKVCKKSYSNMNKNLKKMQIWVSKTQFNPLVPNSLFFDQIRWNLERALLKVQTEFHFFIFSLKGQVKKFFLPVVFDRFGTFINRPPRRRFSTGTGPVKNQWQTEFSYLSL